ncbi:MAG: TonB-dependent receptor, partial [Planctomycetia bacterium]
LSTSIGGRADLVHSSVRDDVLISDFGSQTEWLGMLYGTAKYDVAETASFNAGVGFAMRSASLAELYSKEIFTPVVRTGNNIVIGDSGLNPEKNIQFDLGFRKTGERFTFGLRGFSSLIDDYILVARDGSLDLAKGDSAPADFNDRLGYRYRNLSRATLYGGDVSADWKLLRFLALSGSLTYVKGTNHDPGAFLADSDTTTEFRSSGGSDGLPNIYPLSAFVGLRVFEPEDQRWSVELYSRMAKGQDYLADTLGEAGTPGFSIFGLRGLYQVSEGLRLTGAVNNLFDRSYFEHGSLSLSTPNDVATFVHSPGLNFVFGVEMTY